MDAPVEHLINLLIFTVSKLGRSTKKSDPQFERDQFDA